MKKIAIYGAGEYGKLIFNLLDKEKQNVTCFIDDNSKNIILNDFFPKIISTNDIEKNSHFFEEIIVAIRPRNLTDKDRVRLIEFALKLDCNILFAEDLNNLLNNKLQLHNSLSELSSLLLGREPKKLNDSLVEKFYTNKTILVAGAAGSIGSELVNKLSLISNCKIVGVDKNEEKVFWSKEKFKNNKNIFWKLGNFQDKDFTDKLFLEHQFTIVINAAAFKHVPLFEDNMDYCWRNNLETVFNLDFYSKKYNIANLLQVSTDKAVKPTNIMGASKRACEIYLLNNREKNKYKLTVTRFGNVLGSSGSVLTIFEHYFSNNKPIPITDKRVTRYFMSIEEAVILLLESVVHTSGKKCLFLLDMGDPKNIIDLAEDFLMSKGVIPSYGSNIEEVGLRPGEKLFEELLLENENDIKKIKDKIFIISLSKELIGDSRKIKNLPNIINKEYVKSIIKEYHEN